MNDSPRGREVSPAEQRHFDEHGWVLLHEFIPTDAIDEANVALRHMYPSAEEFFASPDDSGNKRFIEPANPRLAHIDEAQPEDSGPAYRRAQFAGIEDFPFEHLELNRLVVHPVLIRLARRLLRIDYPVLYQAVSFAKYSGATDYEQPLHVDYSTHTVIAPKPSEQVEFFVYLHDVPADLAPPRFVSRTLTGNLPLVPYHVAPLDAPELYAAETSTPAAAGSVVVYGPVTWHRAVDLERPGGARFVLNLSYSRPDMPWIGFQAFGRASLRPAWQRLIEYADPPTLCALGFPRPGHPWWTKDVLRTIQLRYPQTDLSPWWNALSP